MAGTPVAVGRFRGELFLWGCWREKAVFQNGQPEQQKQRDHRGEQSYHDHDVSPRSWRSRRSLDGKPTLSPCDRTGDAAPGNDTCVGRSGDLLP